MQSNDRIIRICVLDDFNNILVCTFGETIGNLLYI